MRRTPPKKDGFFCVGVIATAHGIQGEVVVKTFTEEPESILDYGTLVNFDDVPFSFASIRSSAKGLLARLEGVKSRNDAEKLRGTCLYASNDELPELGDDNVYLSEIIGITLLREDGSIFGKIRNHFDNGAHTVIAVKMPEEGVKDVLLPFTDDVILKVDHDERTIVVSEMADQFATL